MFKPLGYTVPFIFDPVSRNKPQIECDLPVVREQVKPDLVVVGAGPAGLCCAYVACREHPEWRVVVVDAGLPVVSRNANIAWDSANGEGGAGLFSDGKFSFGMAGTASRLINGADKAREEVRQLLAQAGIVAPDDVSSDVASCVDGMHYKPYPTVYGSLEQRKKLISLLTANTTAPFVMYLTVVEFIQPQTDGSFYVGMHQCDRGLPGFYTRRVVVATGRYGPLQRALVPAQQFKRLEFGVRLVAPVGHPIIPVKDASLDPKLVFQSRDKRVEFRTFCVCRDAEIALCDSIDYRVSAYSGRKTDKPTGESNLGLMMRLDASATRALQLSEMSFKTKVFDVRWHAGATWNALHDAYGSEAADLLWEGLQQYAAHLGVTDLSQVRVCGPCYEGFGYYPSVNSITCESRNLPNLYYVGDCAGDYRGLVPAMVAGWACGAKL
jgi:uncharacterized FAD-dependent dehydrogenase